MLVVKELFNIVANGHILLPTVAGGGGAKRMDFIFIGIHLVFGSTTATKFNL